MIKKITPILFAVSIIFSFSLNLQAQNKKDIVGLWQTKGDDGKEAKSEIRVWKIGNEYKAKIEKIYDKESQNDRCTECDKDDPRYNQRVLGMTIMTKLKKTGDNEWTQGKILDPENGSVYDCKMWIADDGKLVIRGYIGLSMFGRSQKWVRLE